MKKRWLSGALILVLCLTLLPAAALADGEKVIQDVSYTVGRELTEDGDALYLNTDTPTVPTYYQAGPTEENYVLFHPGDGDGATLTLHDATFSTSKGEAAIQLPGGTTVVLEGKSTITHNSRCLKAPAGDMTVKGSGTLETFEGTGLHTQDGALTICEGADILVTCTGSTSAILSNNGDLTIRDSAVTVRTENEGMSGSGLVLANGQSSGKATDLTIENSTVDVQSTGTSAIRSVFGSVSLKDSKVIAVGSAAYGQGGGAIAYNGNDGSFSVDGGTLFVWNKNDSEPDIFSDSKARNTAANNAVIYYGGTKVDLVPNGSVIAYGNCGFVAAGEVPEDFAGAVYIYGTVDAAKLPNANGLVSIQKNATLVNNGTLRSDYGIINDGTLTGTGTVHAVVRTTATDEGGTTVYTYTAHGDAKYNEKFVAVGTNKTVVVPEGASLTIPSGHTLDATVAPIDADNFSDYLNVQGSMVVEGVLKLPDGTTPAQIEALNLSGNGDVYMGDVSEKLCTVTFDSQGGSGVESRTVFSGQKLTAPAAPTRAGYAFGGWYKDADCTEAYDFDQEVTAGFTLFAKWTQQSGGTAAYYRLSFDTNGGGEIASILRTENTTVDLSAYKPTREGYVFTGWYGDKALKDRITSIRLTGHTTVYAGWKGVGENLFADVSESDWFYGAVRYAFENGLMNGTGADTFAPYGTTTRGQLATVLYRQAGEPAVSGAKPFSDVPDGAYYHDAVLWAAQNGIVEGYGGGKFGPDDPITREQLATLLWRYAGYRGMDLSAGADADILGFQDGEKVSPYAVPAMKWAVGSGIVQGDDRGSLLPQAGAKRWETAVVLMRFLTGGAA